MHGLILPALLVCATSAGAGELRDIRSILTADQARLVLDLGQRVEYRLRAVPADAAAGVPARLYVELLGTRLGGSVPRHWSPEGGPVERVRAVQVGKALTRLILDVPGLYGYGAFLMLDPFRLVIDARGRSRPVAAAPVAVPQQARLRPAPPSVPVAIPPTGPLHPSSGMTIVLDPGHGGKDPGATGIDGVREKDVVLRLALALRDRLVQAGHRVALTRDRDVYVPLGSRTLIANRAQGSIFLSIHANASKNRAASGIETYYLSNTDDRATIRLARMENHLLFMTGGIRPASSDVSYIVSDMIQSYKANESIVLAERVQSALVGQARLRHSAVHDLGVKPGPFAVLVGSGMPAVLSEVSFLTHPEEGRRLTEASYLDALVEGLLRGLREFAENGEVAANL